ncbi:CRISPR-associated protein Csn2-St [Streptococcus massiliensis]|uniref:CRISPR-associated protein Cas7 n=1 Tax=Streptococcus massiliensis TaxID=313439 RepID=A0A380KX80_9STRE|nr:CRISPR-associated protein Csn2-St [Streptococcus massiliensis]SUN75879.1 CRISPR-associated protein Cas7 [Streptococcus massiliensis]
MKMSFTHPYKENVSISFGQFTQVVGQEQQLKYYIWQLLIWYFEGKKYKVEDLSLFEQEEPKIMLDEKELKRTEYKVLSIANIQDLIEQMVYKKGTIAFDYLKIKMSHLDIVEQIDSINDKLEKISDIVNQGLELEIGEVAYHIESVYFNTEQLILKNFLPYFGVKQQNISFEFVDNETKFLMFLEMLAVVLEKETDKTILLLRNMDDYLTYSSFRICCQKLQELCEIFPNLNIIIFPSNEGYLYVNKENIENVNIFSDLLEHLYEFPFMYERFIGQYPSNDILSEEEFLHSLQKNAGYLFTTDIDHVSLSISDMVAIKIINHLYHYDKKIDFQYHRPNQLLINFLEDSH